MTETPWATWVRGKCLACGLSGTLFVADGNHLTCSNATCPNPTAVADFLEGGREVSS